jgi:hypothetical protein
VPGDAAVVLVGGVDADGVTWQIRLESWPDGQPLLMLAWTRPQADGPDGGSFPDLRDEPDDDGSGVAVTLCASDGSSGSPPRVEYLYGWARAPLAKALLGYPGRAGEPVTVHALPALGISVLVARLRLDDPVDALTLAPADGTVPVVVSLADIQRTRELMRRTLT